MAETGTIEVQMPQMGESVTEGTILEWHVSEGQEVAEGDTVVEVSTDKIDAEVPAPTSGVVTKILAAPDDPALWPAWRAAATCCCRARPVRAAVRGE